MGSYRHATAAREGQLAAVDLLLRRGIEPNRAERGDNTYPVLGVPGVSSTWCRL